MGRQRVLADARGIPARPADRGVALVTGGATGIGAETAIAHVDGSFPAHKMVTLPIANTPLAIEVPSQAPAAPGYAGLSIGKLVMVGSFVAVGLVLVGYLIASFGTTGSRVSIPSVVVWIAVGYRLLKRWS